MAQLFMYFQVTVSSVTFRNLAIILYGQQPNAIAVLPFITLPMSLRCV